MPPCAFLLIAYGLSPSRREPKVEAKPQRLAKQKT
jgi:hypothetical protein